MNIDRRLLALARSQPGLLILTVLCGLLGVLLTASQAAVLSLTVDRVFLGGAGLVQVQRLLTVLLALILGRAVLVSAAEFSAAELALRIKRQVRLRLFDHLTQLGPSFSGAEQTGELNSVLVEGVESLDAYFSQFLPQLFLATLTPAVFLLIVFPLDPLSGLVLLLTGPLIPLFMALIGSAARRLSERQWQTLGRMSAYFLDVLQGLATLKLFGRSRVQTTYIAQVSERYRQATMSVLRITFLSALALELLATISTAVVAVQVGLRLLYGQIPFFEAFFVLLLAPEYYAPLRALGARFHAGMNGVAAAQRVFAILETPSTCRQGGEIHAFTGSSQTDPARPPALELKNVSYSYPDDGLAVRNVTLHIPAGQSLALVGPSGGGKSTLTAMLLGFLAPQTGEITVNGVRLDRLAPEFWRAQIAYVPQAPYLFAGSVADNLRLAKPEATQAEVEHAARQAGAHTFIQALPLGYETPLGERGARLSGGQAQRIALARAFLKDAPFIVLDEASANLDPLIEAELIATLERLLQDRTAALIAHRLNTIQRVDQIAVLEDGRLVAAGPPAELAAQPGPYRRLLEAYNASQPNPPDAALTENLAEIASAGAPAGPVPAPVKRSPEPAPLSRLAVFGRLIGLMRPFAAWTALSVLLGALTIAGGIGLMGASAYIISAAALRPSIADLQVAIVGVRFFGLARGVFRYLERLVSHDVTFRLLARLRSSIYDALEPLAPAVLQRKRAGDVLGILLGDIETLENFYVRGLAPPLTAGLVGLGAALFLGSFAPVLGWAMGAIFLLGGVGIPLLIRLLAQPPGRAVIETRAALYALIVENLQGLPDLLIFDAAGRQRARLEAINCRLQAAQRRIAAINALQAALTGLAGNLALWAILALAIPLVAAGQLQGVYLAGLILAALASFEAIQPLPVAAQHLERDLQAAGRLFAIAASEPEVRATPGARPINRAAHSPSPDLQVRDLTFYYPPETGPTTGADPLPAAITTPESLAARATAAPFTTAPYAAAHVLRPTRQGWPEPGAPPAPALARLTLDLPSGKRLAIVGPSGAGKSTLGALLARFWDYHHGEITLDGIDLRQFFPEDVRRQFAVVSQAAYLFNVSVRENLLIARPQATNEEIEQAARAAQIHELILSLPQGYNTLVGEFGQRLSGGERQRLALARALLKDAPILILDEPTANLDALTARAMMEAILRLPRRRSLLWITHHLTGLEAMDEILVLAEGRVVERGVHAQLLEKAGLYRQMWEAQRLDLF